MRWKALLQADCWCLGKAVEWTEAQASPPKIKIIWLRAPHCHPSPAAWFRYQSFLILALSLSFLLCEMGQQCLLY